MDKHTSTMAKWACGVSASLLAAVGGCLATGCWLGRQPRWWAGRQLEIIQAQLADIKKHLLAYCQSHGRYPTNDEGLAALDNFDARFRARIAVNSCLTSRYLHAVYGGRSGPEGLESSRQAIRGYRARHGRVPQSARELDELLRLPFVCSFEHAVGEGEMEVAIGMSDSLFVLSPAGILTPWMVPYVYENRAGLDGSLFADSPANSDRGGRYSVHVDEGVYVYATGGPSCMQADREEWWAYYGPRLWGLGLVGLAAAGIVVMFCLSWRAGSRGLVAAIGATVGVAIVAPTVFDTTCYVTRPLFSDRDPRMIGLQRDLLEKYHSKGVITDATHQKAIAALDAAAPPASER